MKYFVYLFFIIGFLACKDNEEPATENTTITPNVGVGDISFQDDGNAIVTLHGDYDRINLVNSPDGANFAIWYDAIGLGYQLDKVDVGNLSLQEILNMADDLVDLNQKITTIIIRSPFEGATAEGIKLGSTKASVIEAFGQPDDSDLTTETYESLNTIFSYSSTDSTVIRIDLVK